MKKKPGPCETERVSKRDRSIGRGGEEKTERERVREGVG